MRKMRLVSRLKIWQRKYTSVDQHRTVGAEKATTTSPEKKSYSVGLPLNACAYHDAVPEAEI